MTVQRVRHQAKAIQTVERGRQSTANATAQVWNDRSRRSFDAQITQPLDVEARHALAAVEQLGAELQASQAKLR